MTESEAAVGIRYAFDTPSALPSEALVLTFFFWQQQIPALRIAAFELLFLAAQTLDTGLDTRGFALVNNLMGFVAAVAVCIVLSRDSGEEYRFPKSTYFFLLLWILIDISKLSGYLFDQNKHILSFGGYITGFYRSDLLTDMLMPSVKPGPDLVTLLSQLDAKHGRTMPQSTPECRSEAASEDAPQEASEKTSERTSEEAIEDILKAWNNTGGCSARAPSKAQKKKKKHTRNMRHKAR